MSVKLKIIDLIDSDLAVSADKGEIVFENISENMKNGVSSILDFSEIRTVTTAFLNTAIGELYKHNDSTTLNSLITIDSSTLSVYQGEKVKLVMANSKKKYTKEFYTKVEGITINGYDS